MVESLVVSDSLCPLGEQQVVLSIPEEEGNEYTGRRQAEVGVVYNLPSGQRTFKVFFHWPMLSLLIPAGNAGVSRRHLDS